jgi:ferrous iron transport protein A
LSKYFFPIKEMISILDLKIGERARITNYSSQNIPTRLCEMCLLPGTTLEMKSFAFNKSACYLSFCENNAKIVLRKQEANFLLIEKI